MPFVELIRPPAGASKTGVRLTLGPKGVTVSISGQALDALGTPPAGLTCKVYHDADTTNPMLRIEVHKDGKFVLAKPNRGKAQIRVLRLGNALKAGAAAHRKHDASWETVDGKCAIDVDLPIRHATKETEIARQVSTGGAIAPRIASRPTPPLPLREGPQHAGNGRQRPRV